MVTFFRISCLLSDNVEKYGTVREATDDNVTAHAHCCSITKATETHSEYILLTAFPRQQWLRERAWMGVYRYTACLHTAYLR
jgi:hypothetical protein